MTLKLVFTEVRFRSRVLLNRHSQKRRRAVAHERIAGPQVTVNAVAPGPIATELFLNGKTENQIAEFTKMSPLGRIGQPGDIANVRSFLAGPDGGWINSQVLRANGGFAY